MFTEIEIQNFKSLRSVKIPFKRLSYFCGPNASGKSNFAEALDFVSNVFRNGLQHAVAEKGGFYNMCFRRIRRTKGAIAFRIVGREKLTKEISVQYEVKFSFRTQTEAIRSQFLVQSEDYYFHVFSDDETEKFVNLLISRKDDTYAAQMSNSIFGPIENVFSFKTVEKLNTALAAGYKARPQRLLIAGNSSFLFELFEDAWLLQRDLEGLRVFQMNPRTARQAGTPSVYEGLGRHGENLPVVVEAFLNRKNLAPRLLSWMQDILPNLGGLLTDYTQTKQIGLFIQERGFGAPWYVEDVSDGTIMALGLFIALLEPDHRTILIEEPENCLHPWVLMRFLEHCREISESKQVLITTHSPLVVGGARPEELFLIDRVQGETEIVPAQLKEPHLDTIVRKQALDLGEYWVSGGIGGVPEAPALPPSDSLPKKSQEE
jgi:predicted ATPase